MGGVGAGAGSVTLPFVVPATVVSGTLFTQCLVAEGTSPLGFVVSNGVATTLHP